MQKPQDWPDSRESWRNRQTMVTGGNGFLGKFIVGKLHDRGAAVFVANMDHYDLRRLDDIRRALSDGQPQMVTHLAARHGPVYPLMYVRALHAKKAISRDLRERGIRADAIRTDAWE